MVPDQALLRKLIKQFGIVTTIPEGSFILPDGRLLGRPASVEEIARTNYRPYPRLLTHDEVAEKMGFSEEGYVSAYVKMMARTGIIRIGSDSLPYDKILYEMVSVPTVSQVETMANLGEMNDVDLLLTDPNTNFEIFYSTTREASKAKVKGLVNRALRAARVARGEAENPRRRNPHVDEMAGSPEKTEAYLKSNFPALVGLEQHSPHHGLDPVEHTGRVMRLLDVSGLSPVDAQLLRAAMAFHDIAKARDAFDSEHPRKSADEADELLDEVTITDGGRRRAMTAGEKQDVLHVIRWHDAVGDSIHKSYKMPMRRLLEISRTPRMADLLARAYAADAGSIPGFSGPTRIRREADQQLAVVKQALVERGMGNPLWGARR